MGSKSKDGNRVRVERKKRILYFAIQDPIIAERKSTAAIVAANADDAQKKKKTGIYRKY